MPNDHASLLAPTHEACGRDLAAGRCNPLPKYVAPMRREVVLGSSSTVRVGAQLLEI